MVDAYLQKKKKINISPAEVQRTLERNSVSTPPLFPLFLFLPILLSLPVYESEVFMLFLFIIISCTRRNSSEKWPFLLYRLEEKKKLCKQTNPIYATKKKKNNNNTKPRHSLPFAYTRFERERERSGISKEKESNEKKGFNSLLLNSSTLFDFAFFLFKIRHV